MDSTLCFVIVAFGYIFCRGLLEVWLDGAQHREYVRALRKRTQQQILDEEYYRQNSRWNDVYYVARKYAAGKLDFVVFEDEEALRDKRKRELEEWRKEYELRWNKKNQDRRKNLQREKTEKMSDMWEFQKRFRQVFLRTSWKC